MLRFSVINELFTDHSVRMSESPASMMAMVEQRWYLPQAVPREMLFPG